MSQKIEGGSARRGKLRWRLIAAASVAGTLGLLILGAALGQFLWPAHVTQQVVVAASETPAAQVAEAVQFPHVLGLDAATARGAIAAAGFREVDLRIKRAPAAGPKDFVVGQAPDPYTVATVELAAAELTLSTPVTMPNLVGKSADAARLAVTRLWGVPQFVRVTTADQPAGVVLSTEPAAGEAMPVNVTINVSDGGESLPLTNLDAVDSTGCQRLTDQTINGQLHPTALVCVPGSADRPAFVDYAIGRHATYLDATVGMSDTADVGSAKIRVIGDGKLIASKVLKFGTAAPLHVDTRGVLRLRIEVSGPDVAQRPRLVLGSVRLVGNPDALDQLEG